jgi:hypothetical protein
MTLGNMRATGLATRSSNEAKQPAGPPMDPANMREPGVQRLIASGVAAFPGTDTATHSLPGPSRLATF